MARRKALPHVQQHNANSSHASPTTISQLSAREYYSARYEKVDNSHQSTTLYTDVTNQHIDRFEGLWSERVTSSMDFTVVLLTFLILNL